MNIHSAIDIITTTGKGVATDFAGLKKLYKRAALVCHPDRTKASESAVTMKELNEAWEFICNRIELANQTLIQTFDNTLSATSFINDVIESHELTHSKLPTFASRETLLREAFTIIDDDKWNDWSSARFKTLYFRKLEVRLHIYSSSIRITTLTNALEARKTCEVFKISWEMGSDAEGYCSFLDWIGGISKDRSISDVIAQVSIAEYREQRNGEFKAELAPGLFIERHTEKSGRVFSPFKLDKIRPITEIPARFNASHLIKVLANGQYRKLHRSFYYTDDYLYDTCNNYGAKVYENPFSLLVGLIENRSKCFHIYHSGQGVYCFGNHSNDGKSIIPVIENRFPAIDIISIKADKQVYLEQ